MPASHLYSKWAYYVIVKTMDGSTGAGSDDIDDDDRGVKVGAGKGGQQEDNESSLNEESGAFVEDIVAIDHGDQGGGTCLGVDPTNLFGDLANTNDINGA